MQGYVIKKDNKKEEGNKSLESKNNTDDGLSNKNKFEILGVIEEEVMDRMEEDAKGEKVAIHQKKECVGSSIDVNEIMNNKILPSNEGEEGKIGKESYKMKNCGKDQENNNSKNGISLALEEVNAKNSTNSQ